MVATFQHVCDLCPGIKVSLEFKPTDEAARFTLVPSTGAALLLMQQVGGRHAEGLPSFRKKIDPGTDGVAGTLGWQEFVGAVYFHERPVQQVGGEAEMVARGGLIAMLQGA